MILGIDTSLGTTVAVVDPDGLVRAQLNSADPRGHAEVIGSLLERVLAEAGAGPTDITHVAAGMGPGPFTGLRVGIAAARTFALGRGIPFIPVVSHDAVALELLLHDALTGGWEETADEPFAVCTDARRREFAYTVYRGLDEDGLPVRLAEPALIPREDLDARLTADRVLRRDADRIPAAMLALAAGRAVAADRAVGPDDALYLRSPDVTPSHGPKRVSA
ncbi:tRNA (adenosine(37)-N6)-threonylcarbamoyltransferase complex dimerization subunit type 1 TsaB [Microbacterium thalassium]|uniref:tRNA threonylcarbamoyl adenosine modification protein YeaZ n=1 Tax=Microbacterium thalassium TaxID=362649 RepID=A0A7X0KUH7_9MICO|nr:tRNA (adenosine(37)-N6)-threonylcarbamoyltransferase complex dimerization subunit type 1 TsaB [Microbacterium thalassium]MBB6391128.1 tRNA threonylcarbamoyl adenosine modification protein YeaZ [Microbacterium thalassium]GLK23762.1 tRNA (adenosine(37)-N6)-threonylcarbamoyltransferase complex dimerization subunit type 1 TsaB [Microbacterium thalassium]